MGRGRRGNTAKFFPPHNPPGKGQGPADFLLDLLQPGGVRVTRLARGMPMGGELEYMDAGTLNQAFSERREV